MEEKEIIKQVANLFHRYGIKSVTMDDVAHELGISKKTLYGIFSDKSDLVSKTIKIQMEYQKEKFIEATQNVNNAMDEMFGIFKHYLQLLKDHFPSFEFDLKKYYPEIFHNVCIEKREIIQENIKKNLIRGKKEGFYRKELNEEVITKLNILRVESLADSKLFTQEELLSPEFGKEMFLYHLYGILSSKGIEYLNKNMDQFDISK